MATILENIKLRLGIWYSDSIKDKEIEERIKACQEDMLLAGVPTENLETSLALDTIERYVNGGQNDPIYIANLVKLKKIR